MPAQAPAPAPATIARAVEAALEKGQVSRPSADLVSNAPIDSASMLSIIQSVDPAFHVAHSDYNLGSKGVTALVGFDKGQDANRLDRIFVTVSHYAQPNDALERMKSSLASFDSNVDEVVSKPSDPIGTTALQTPLNVFWVRGSIFADVGSDNQQAVVSKNPPLPTLTRIAARVDDHLAKNAVAANKQQTVHPTLLSSQRLTVEQGKPFTLQLGALDYTLDTKTAEVEDTKVVQTTNVELPDGKFAFLPTSVGTTKIKLVVAQASNLSVAAQEVEVTVTASTDRRSGLEKLQDSMGVPRQ